MQGKLHPPTLYRWVLRVLIVGVIVGVTFSAGFLYGRTGEQAPRAEASGLYADWCIYTMRDEPYTYLRGSYKVIVAYVGNWNGFILDRDARRAVADFDCERQ
jgi:hypothetical protein